MGNIFVLPYTTFEGNPEWGYKWKGNLHTVFGRISHPSFVPFDPYLIYYSVVSHPKKKKKKKGKKKKKRLMCQKQVTLDIHLFMTFW